MCAPVVKTCRCCECEDTPGENTRRLMQGSIQVSKTGELCRIQYDGSNRNHANVCIRWPKYDGSNFEVGNVGVSMLELTTEEQSSLGIIVLRTQVAVSCLFPYEKGNRDGTQS